MAVATWEGASGEQLWFGSLEIGGHVLHPLALLFAVSGSLMISRIKIPKL
jgi:CDP-diacylglycerol--serine O-phosphatidyltransferase